MIVRAADFPGLRLLSRPQRPPAAGFADVMLEPSRGAAAAQAKGQPESTTERAGECRRGISAAGTAGGLSCFVPLRTSQQSAKASALGATRWTFSVFLFLPSLQCLLLAKSKRKPSSQRTANTEDGLLSPAYRADQRRVDVGLWVDELDE